MTVLRILKRAFLFLFLAPGLIHSLPYYGEPLGAFITVSNNVKGEVFAVDVGTLFIKDFSYDGHNEDAVFWAGFSEKPDTSGFILTNETSEIKTLHPYSTHNVILRLPKDKSLEDIRWLSVWNRISSKSLGTLVFSKSIQPPEPTPIGSLLQTKNGVSTGEILILDTQTFLIRHFSYDGSQKETYWWLSVGKIPDERGVPLLENGSDAPLEETVNRTVLITLPKGHFVADYETLSIWNRLDGDNYGFVPIPKNLNVPPSSRILGIEEPEMKDFNCEILNDKLGLQVRWVIRGYDVIIYLIGNIGPNEYMALGLSKDDTETRFESSDAMIAGLDANGNAFVTDYFFESNQKCENGQGMCPDSIYGSDNNLELLHAERYENSTVISFKRHLRAEDKVYDQNIYTDGPQAILWAVGSLLPEGFLATPIFHNKKNLLMDFGRGPSWNCPPLQRANPPLISTEAKIQHIHCPSERSFRAQLGSSSWNNEKKVWFINGIPTPELTVQRGSTYTFIIEGGLKPPHHHPFYITNNKEGGLYKDILEANETIEVTFAGIEQDHATGKIFPTAEGRLCDWSYSAINPEYSVLTLHQDIKPTLSLKCEPGQPGKLIWTPSAETPNEVYYQSYTERNIGGKIHVVDFCEETISHRFLEINTKGGKPKIYLPFSQKDELERESEIDEYDIFLNVEEKVHHIEDSRIKHQEDSKSNSTVTIPEKESLKLEINTLSNNVINSFKSNSHNEKEILNDADDVQFSESTTSPIFQVTENPDELFPHDESERSDVYLPHRTNFKQTLNYNAATRSSSHRNAENLPIKYATHSASQVSSVSALENQPLQDFKPHFEGGFVPLVMNPMKEKEFVQTKEFIHATQHRSRPHRPFLYNESVPFHGTFKPGVPDFSGFNISNYSQEDASIIIAPNQDNLSILSASKLQPVRKPFSPFGAIPLHLLHRPNEQVPRPQRLQNFGYIFQQQPPLMGVRKNVLPPVSLNNKSNFPNIRDEDLAGISSQRVYVSMQATGDKNTNVPNLPHLTMPSSFNRNQQNAQPNKMIYPPPIQRRPDFYEGKEPNIHQSNVPQRNLNTPQVPTALNNHHNGQKLNLPFLQTGGLQGQGNIRQNSKPLITHIQGQGEHAIIPQGPLRQSYHAPQIASRERIPQMSLFPKGMHIRPNPQTDENLKVLDDLVSKPQKMGNRIPLPLHVINTNEKASQPPQILDSSSRHLPQIINAELVEMPNKNIPKAIPKEKPTINPIQLMQQLPFNGSQSTFSHNANIRTPQILLTLNNPKNLPAGEGTNFAKHSGGHAQDVNVFQNGETTSEMRNTPLNPNHHDVLQQQSSKERNQVAKEKIIYNASHQTYETRPAAFQEHELKKPVLETSLPAEMSVSKPTKIGLSPLLEYESEIDDSESSDSIASDADHSVYKVPFGARLKFPQNGSKIPLKNLNETPKRPLGITRKPERNVFKSPDKNPNSSVKAKDSIRPSTVSTTSRSSTTSTTTEATLVAMESISHASYTNKQNASSEKQDYIKKLYYTPPLSSLPKVPDIFNSSTNLNQYTGSNEVKHIPIIADTLDGIIETYYPGRKNILPNNSHPPLLPFVIPPKISENINLPQISENPPTHDNRTDYSILNHILTLIGGPSESKNVQLS